MKKFIFFLFVFLVIPQMCFASNQIDIENFLIDASKYATDIMPELNNKELLNEVISGKAFNVENILVRILNIFVGDIRESFNLIFTIIAVSILCSILKNIQQDSNTTVSEVAFYVCYIFIVILVINSFTEIIATCRETIIKLNDFMNILIPLILTLLVTNGNIASVGMMQPVLLLMTSLINILISSIALPIIFISTMMNIISNIYENISLTKLPKLLQKSTVWCVEFLLIVFIRYSLNRRQFGI